MQLLHDSGVSARECAERFGFSIQAWYKACRRGDIASHAPRDARRRYDWEDIQRYYDAGNSIHACMDHFGFSLGAWQKARRRSAMRIRPSRIPIDTLLRRSKHRSSIKRRLLLEGLLKPECSRCGISTWRGKPLSIQIDHINGVNNDNRLENLRMLCANCHSLTPTHAGRNRRPPRAPQSDRGEG